MGNKEVAKTYKQTDQDYVSGIESPHGRITILYQTIITNLDKLNIQHPKTDFVSFGKCVNALKILSAALDKDAGKDLAENLDNLYIYCSNRLREYLEDKNEHKIIEVREIISGLLEAWEQAKK